MSVYERLVKLQRSCWACVVIPVILLLGVWAFIIEPRWVAHREITELVSNWKGPPGLKVAVASDWHFTKRPLRRVMTVERARDIVAQINAAQPDVVLLPGDFIADRDYQPDTAATPEDEIAQVLGGLKARLGVYAVMGNHDWWHDGEKFTAAFTRAGITVLESDAVPLPGTPIWVVGVGDDDTGHSHPVRAMSKVPKGAQALVFMHEPASFMDLPSVRGLIVAGHTHGGQVYLPFAGALVVPGAGPKDWAYGWVAHGDNRMYITSGLGVSILPVRFNMRPEWVMFTLNSTSAINAPHATNGNSTTESSQMKFDAVLFDCDGVLVDSEPITNGILRDMLEEQGWKLSSAECMRLFVGKAVIDEAATIEARTGKPVTKAWLDEFRGRRNEGLVESLLAVHGAVEAVSQIHTAYQGRIACASGADRFKVELQLKKCGLMPFFEDRIFSGHELPRSKPFPDVYLAAAAALGVDPKRCAVVEDTVTGVTAGVAAGCTVFGFSPAELGHDAPKALLATGAVHVFTDMADLPALLG